MIPVVEYLRRKKKTEEEKHAKSQDLPKANKVKVPMDSLGSFASEFTSFLTKQLFSTGDKPKESKQEESKHDLSNFWKDLGFSPEGIKFIFIKRALFIVDLRIIQMRYTEFVWLFIWVKK